LVAPADALVAAAATASVVPVSSGIGMGGVLGVAAVGGGIAAAAGGGGDDSDGGGGGSVGAAACSVTQVPGGDTPESRNVNLGKTSGTFVFTYDTRFQEDRMVVLYQGGVLFDTGCVGTGGDRSVPLTYSGSNAFVTVQVTPNCAGGTGTIWEFTVNCP
jgi:hypothetical protein